MIRPDVNDAKSLATTLLMYLINSGSTISLTVVNEAQTRSKIKIARYGLKYGTNLPIRYRDDMIKKQST